MLSRGKPRSASVTTSPSTANISSSSPSFSTGAAGTVQTVARSRSSNATHYEHSIADNAQYDKEARKMQEKMSAALKAKEATEERTHVKIRLGQGIGSDSSFTHGRYKVHRLLGKGVYGKVFECSDLKYDGALVAIKIVRNEPLFRQAALNEIKVLKKLDGKCGLLRICRDFSHLNHVCISVDLYGESLSQKIQRVQSLSLQQVADVGLQLLHGINHMHKCGIVHTDLKTENVLVYHRADTSTGLHNDDINFPLSVRIVDLGSAVFENAWHQDCIGTNEYRAPEAVLHTGWSYQVDVWAIGCVLVELTLGKKLFGEQLADNVHLMLIEKCLERTLPVDMLKKSWSKGITRNNGSLLGATRVNPKTSDILQKKKLHEAFVLRKEIADTGLLDLLYRMFEIDPVKRARAGQLREHDFFEMARFDRSDIDTQSAYPPIFPQNLRESFALQAEGSDWAVAGDGASTPPRRNSAPPDVNITPPPSNRMQPCDLAPENEAAPMSSSSTAGNSSNDAVPDLPDSQPYMRAPRPQTIKSPDHEQLSSSEPMDSRASRRCKNDSAAAFNDGNDRAAGGAAPQTHTLISNTLFQAHGQLKKLSEFLEHTRLEVDNTAARISQHREEIVAKYPALQAPTTDDATATQAVGNRAVQGAEGMKTPPALVPMAQMQEPLLLVAHEGPVRTRRM